MSWRFRRYYYLRSVTIPASVTIFPIFLLFLLSYLILSPILSFTDLIFWISYLSILSMISVILSYLNMQLPHVRHAFNMCSFLYILYLSCNCSLASYYLLTLNNSLFSL